MKICQNCGHENSDSGKFCEECGTKLVEAPKFCPECGTKLEGTPKFCPECGFSLLSGEKNDEDYSTEYEDDETTEEKIRKIVDKYIDVISTDTSTWYRSAAVQDSKYSQVFQNVRANIAKDISQSEIIGFIDITVFGKGKNGLLFTTSALYEKSAGAWWKVPYNKMGRMKSNGKQITFEGTEGCGRGLNGIGDISINSGFYNIPALKDCLEEIYAII